MLTRIPVIHRGQHLVRLMDCQHWPFCQDIDGAGSNVGRGDNGDTSHTAVENAYLGWRSGDLFSSLGKNFLDVSFGMQQYVAGNGFLFYSQSSNGKNRGAYWTGERKAAEYAGIAKVNYGQFKGDLVYFKANDNPCVPADKLRTYGLLNLSDNASSNSFTSPICNTPTEDVYLILQLNLSLVKYSRNKINAKRNV